MYKSLYLAPLLVLWISCVPMGERTVVKEGVLTDTILVTEVPAKVETVYVTTVETVVETVEVAPGVLPKKVGPFKVQIGAFKEEGNATALYEKWKGEYGDLIYVENIPPYWKVRVGNYKSYRKALLMRDELRKKGFSDAWIVPMNRFK